jgi:protein-disulfide isomerase
VTDTDELLVQPVDLTDHTLGPAAAPVTVVMYGDFQCPFCAAAARALGALARRHVDDLRLVFRHFPVVALHRDAPGAALAAEAAAAQGRFWSMHDMLFEHQTALKAGDLLRYAVALELDTDRFTSDLTGAIYKDRVQRDLASGQASGVDSTPALFVDGVRRRVGTHDPRHVMHVVDEHLSLKG